MKQAYCCQAGPCAVIMPLPPVTYEKRQRANRAPRHFSLA